MNKYGLKFHHFGLAVVNHTKAVAFLQNMDYNIGEVIFDVLQDVNLIYCNHKSMPDVEIICKDKNDGPLISILKNSKELIYHICYETNSLEYFLNTIKKDKIRLVTISKPKPAILFFNKNVSFYYVDGFGIIEILES